MVSTEIPDTRGSLDSMAHDRGPLLVPPDVTWAKFQEQLDRWHANASAYARRGWLLLSTSDLSVDIGFLQNVAMGGRTIPVMTACVRLDYWNFDLWPPSLTFLDPMTRQPAPPPVRAPDRFSATEVRDALIDQHPATLQPFLCLPGIREYHSHPQHSGDDWLLHRHLREGDVAVVCERIWRRMARNVLGMSVAIQSLAPANETSIANQLDINLLQGDADLVQRQLAQQQAAQEAAQGADNHRRPAPDVADTDAGTGPELASNARPAAGSGDFLPASAAEVLPATTESDDQADDLASAELAANPGPAPLPALASSERKAGNGPVLSQ